MKRIALLTLLLGLTQNIQFSYAEIDLSSLPLPDDTSVYKMTFVENKATIEVQERVMQAFTAQAKSLSQVELEYLSIVKVGNASQKELSRRSLQNFIEFAIYFEKCEELEIKTKGKVLGKRINREVNGQTILNACQFTTLDPQNANPVTTTISPEVANWVIEQADSKIHIELIRHMKAKRISALDAISIRS